MPNYYYKRGQVLVCDFSTGFVVPEMVKKRLAVVVSPDDTHGRGLYTIVPLSTTEPRAVKPWHLDLPHLRVPGWAIDQHRWAKCDMIATVSATRLDRPHSRSAAGNREYHQIFVSVLDLANLLDAVASYLAINRGPSLPR